MDKNEWLNLQEELLKAQIRVVRHHLGKDTRKTRAVAEEPGSRSQMSIVLDILGATPHPLHVSEIIRTAKERHGLSLDRESLVSALTKKVKKEAGVIRVGPNTFALKG